MTLLKTAILLLLAPNAVFAEEEKEKIDWSRSPIAMAPPKDYMDKLKSAAPTASARGDSAEKLKAGATSLRASAPSARDAGAKAKGALSTTAGKAAKLAPKELPTRVDPKKLPTRPDPELEELLKLRCTAPKKQRGCDAECTEAMNKFLDCQLAVIVRHAAGTLCTGDAAAKRECTAGLTESKATCDKLEWDTADGKSADSRNACLKKLKEGIEGRMKVSSKSAGSAKASLAELCKPEDKRPEIAPARPGMLDRPTPAEEARKEAGAICERFGKDSERCKNATAELKPSPNKPPPKKDLPPLSTAVLESREAGKTADELCEKEGRETDACLEAQRKAEFLGSKAGTPTRDIAPSRPSPGGKGAPTREAPPKQTREAPPKQASGRAPAPKRDGRVLTANSGVEALEAWDVQFGGVAEGLLRDLTEEEAAADSKPLSRVVDTSTLSETVSASGVSKLGEITNADLKTKYDEASAAVEAAKKSSKEHAATAKEVCADRTNADCAAHRTRAGEMTKDVSTKEAALKLVGTEIRKDTACTKDGSLQEAAEFSFGACDHFTALLAIEQAKKRTSLACAEHGKGDSAKDATCTTARQRVVSMMDAEKTRLKTAMDASCKSDIVDVDKTKCNALRAQLAGMEPPAPKKAGIPTAAQADARKRAGEICEKNGKDSDECKQATARLDAVATSERASRDVGGTDDALLKMRKDIAQLEKDAEGHCARTDNEEAQKSCEGYKTRIDRLKLKLNEELKKKPAPKSKITVETFASIREKMNKLCVGETARSEDCQTLRKEAHEAHELLCKRDAAPKKKPVVHGTKAVDWSQFGPAPKPKQEQGLLGKLASAGAAATSSMVASRAEVAESGDAAATRAKPVLPKIVPTHLNEEYLKKRDPKKTHDGKARKAPKKIKQKKIPMKSKIKAKIPKNMTSEQLQQNTAFVGVVKTGIANSLGVLESDVAIKSLKLKDALSGTRRLSEKESQELEVDYTITTEQKCDETGSNCDEDTTAKAIETKMADKAALATAMKAELELQIASVPEVAAIVEVEEIEEVVQEAIEEVVIDEEVCVDGEYAMAYKCYACPLGTYTETAGSMSCLLCADGYTTRVMGASSSDACEEVPQLDSGAFANSVGLFSIVLSFALAGAAVLF